MNKQKKAFTLVELLVVVSIVMTLGTIGFMGFGTYMENTRDSSRTLEFKNIEGAMNSYIFKNLVYPLPKDGVEISYSGGLVWTQGTFDNHLSNVIGYSEDVLDPLTNNFYTYSVTNNRKSYSIAGVLENNNVTILNITSKALANIGDYVALVSGNYNGEIINIKTSSNNYILALPSIVSTDILSSTDLVDIINEKKLVYDGYLNLPSSYSESRYIVSNNMDFTPNQLIVFSGSLSKLKKISNRVELLKNINSAYDTHILKRKILANKINPADLNNATVSNETQKVACDIINFKLRYPIECPGLDLMTAYIINTLDIPFSSEDIEVVYKGEDGIYVIGTDDSLNFFNGIDWITYTDSELLDDKIQAIIQDLNGNYWIGTDEGINIINLGSDFSNIADDTITESFPGSGDENEIESLTLGLDGKIWTGTEEGATYFDGTTWIEYTDEDEVKTIFADSKNNIWIGFKSDGLEKYNVTAGTNILYKEGDSLDSLPDDDIRAILEDSTGKVWIGTKKGLGITSDYGATWESHIDDGDMNLSDDEVNHIFEDSSGKIWVSTDEGVSRFNGTNWYSYSKNKTTDVTGLKDNKVISVNENSFGEIFIFTENGVDIIDSSGNIK